jgi:hypothetical protein
MKIQIKTFSISVELPKKPVERQYNYSSWAQDVNEMPMNSKMNLHPSPSHVASRVTLSTPYLENVQAKDLEHKYQAQKPSMAKNQIQHFEQQGYDEKEFNVINCAQNWSIAENTDVECSKNVPIKVSSPTVAENDTAECTNKNDGGNGESESNDQTLPHGAYYG